MSIIGKELEKAANEKFNEEEKAKVEGKILIRNNSVEGLRRLHS